MGFSQLLISAGLIHLATASTAFFVLVRSDSCTVRQRATQSVLAFLVPVLGPLVVILVAREATSPFPKPDESRFDRHEVG